MSNSKDDDVRRDVLNRLVLKPRMKEAEHRPWHAQARRLSHCAVSAMHVDTFKLNSNGVYVPYVRDEHGELVQVAFASMPARQKDWTQVQRPRSQWQPRACPEEFSKPPYLSFPGGLIRRARSR
jgi:hypothetical protein